MESIYLKYLKTATYKDIKIEISDETFSYFMTNDFSEVKKFLENA